MSYSAEATQFTFVHGLPLLPEVGAVHIKLPEPVLIFNLRLSLGQALSQNGELDSTVAVHNLTLPLTVQAKAAATMAKTLRDRSINFTFFIKEVLFKSKS